MTFHEAQSRLLIELKTQVRNGQLTERGGYSAESEQRSGLNPNRIPG